MSGPGSRSSRPTASRRGSRARRTSRARCPACPRPGHRWPAGRPDRSVARGAGCRPAPGRRGAERGGAGPGPSAAARTAHTRGGTPGRGCGTRAGRPCRGGPGSPGWPAVRRRAVRRSARLSPRTAPSRLAWPWFPCLLPAVHRFSGSCGDRLNGPGVRRGLGPGHKMPRAAKVPRCPAHRRQQFQPAPPAASGGLRPLTC